MKTVLNCLITSIFVLIIHNNYCDAQIDTIKAANLTFKLPNNNWKLKEVQTKNRQTLYNYERTPIIDNAGRMVTPIITFSVENVPEDFNLAKFTKQKEAECPYKIIAIFDYKSDTPIIKYNDAIGWECIYTEKNIQHNLYFIHLKNKNKGVQIVMDMTSDLFKNYKKEFTDALLSIKGIK
jgi:hypothetical protein